MYQIIYFLTFYHFYGNFNKIGSILLRQLIIRILSTVYGVVLINCESFINFIYNLIFNSDMMNISQNSTKLVLYVSYILEFIESYIYVNCKHVSNMCLETAAYNVYMNYLYGCVYILAHFEINKQGKYPIVYSLYIHRIWKFAFIGVIFTSLIPKV